LQSEKTERTFAHVCETGGARRTWLVGIENIRKRYLLSAEAHNSSVLMRALFGMGAPRGRQQFGKGFEGLDSSLYLPWLVVRDWGRVLASRLAIQPPCADSSSAMVVCRVKPAYFKGLLGTASKRR
jgi:hypothetical protein